MVSSQWFQTGLNFLSTLQEVLCSSESLMISVPLKAKD